MPTDLILLMPQNASWRGSGQPSLALWKASALTLCSRSVGTLERARRAWSPVQNSMGPKSAKISAACGPASDLLQEPCYRIAADLPPVEADAVGMATPSCSLRLSIADLDHVGLAAPARAARTGAP